MTKSDENKKWLTILRWVALLPAVCLVWWIIPIICLYIERLLSLELLMWPLIIYFTILPAIAMFFVAKFIAPKYKITMGCAAILLCIIWDLLLWYGLSHLAY